MPRETPKVSIILPSRQEYRDLPDGRRLNFLALTVRDLLAKATGNIEIIAVCDGYWDHELPADRRLKILHHGRAQGMREANNAGCAIATGDYFMKIDAHCMVGEGFDEILAAECDRDWIVVPRRYSLDPDTWGIQQNGKSPVDAHYLSYPYERPGDSSCGLHGTVWRDRARARTHIPLDEEMSSQGSCWFMHRDHWEQRIGPMEIAKYGNFIQEFQELGLKTWLGGGKVMVNKRTFYAHLHKGKQFGRGYFISKQEMEAGARFAVDYWLFDRWAERKRDLKWFIDRFWPVPGWPADWEAHRFLHHKALRAA